MHVSLPVCLRAMMGMQVGISFCNPDFQYYALRIFNNLMGGSNWTVPWPPPPADMPGSGSTCTQTSGSLSATVPAWCCWHGVSCCLSSEPCPVDTVDTAPCGNCTVGQITALNLEYNNVGAGPCVCPLVLIRGRQTVSAPRLHVLSSIFMLYNCRHCSLNAACWISQQLFLNRIQYHRPRGPCLFGMRPPHLASSKQLPNWHNPPPNGLGDGSAPGLESGLQPNQRNVRWYI